MALIGRRVVPLALEDVAQVTTAVCADNLSARHAEGAVLVADDGAGNAVKVGRPTAARVELVGRLVERRVAPGTCIDTRIWRVLVVLASAWAFGALFAEDAELLLVQDCPPLIVGTLVRIRHLGRFR